MSRTYLSVEVGSAHCAYEACSFKLKLHLLQPTLAIATIAGIPVKFMGD
jgi:hypothetical protein